MKRKYVKSTCRYSYRKGTPELDKYFRGYMNNFS